MHRLKSHINHGLRESLNLSVAIYMARVQCVWRKPLHVQLGYESNQPTGNNIETTRLDQIG